MTDKTPAMPEPLGWYVVNNIGMATLCKDEAEAQLLAEDCDMVYQRQAPHRAVQLVALAALQSQPAAPQGVLMRLAAIAAECSDPDTTDALDALIASASEQPAAAVVSDAEIDAIWRESLALPCSPHQSVIRFARAILALRPQSAIVGRTIGDGSGQAVIYDTTLPDSTPLYADALRPQAVPMTDTMPQDMGQATIMGDCIYAGIFEDEVSEVKSAVVIKFESDDKLRDFLRWHHGITAQGAQGEQG